LGSLADDRLIRVGGHADGAVLQLFHEPFSLEYELSLDDTERDPNLQKEYEENVMKLAPTLIRMNMFLPELLDYARLPYRFKKAIKDAIRAQAQARQEAAAKGIPTGGRSAPVTPEERQANINKTVMETDVQRARAERLRTQSKRDEVRTLMDTLLKAEELRLERSKHSMEKEKHTSEVATQSVERSQAALDVYQQAKSGGKPVKPSAPRAS
jgi:hypothetical protein